MSGNTRAIVLGGVTAGALDILSAFVIWAPRGVTPTRVLQAVASGLLGRSAFRGGTSTAILGAALHFVIAFAAAAVFVFAARRIAFLVHRPVIAGLLYGVIVYLVMHAIVVPLSAATMRHTATSIALGLVVHMLLVGLPIALAARRTS